MPRKENTNYSHHFLFFIYRHILKVETQKLASPEQISQIFRHAFITVNIANFLVRRKILRLYFGYPANTIVSFPIDNNKGASQ